MTKTAQTSFPLRHLPFIYWMIYNVASGWLKEQRCPYVGMEQTTQCWQQPSVCVCLTAERKRQDTQWKWELKPAELWSTTNHTGPRMETPYPATDGHTSDSFQCSDFIVLASTVMVLSPNTRPQAESISSHFSWFVAVVASISACLLFISSVFHAASHYDILYCQLSHTQLPLWDNGTRDSTTTTVWSE